MSRKRKSTKTSHHKVRKASHPFAAKLRLLRHAHTGRVVHRQHTSYGILLILLVITGFFVLIGYDITSADTQSGNVTVGMTVPSDPPSQGAFITTPTNGMVFKKSIIDVKGTCSISSAVVIYSNNALVGSTLCTTTSKFQLKIQLFGGMNSLTALNYDGINQAGPITPSVKVTYDIPVSSPSSPLPVLPIVVPGVTPTPPQTCIKKPSADACHLTYSASDTCDNYIGSKIIPKSAGVRVAIVCLQRNADTLGESTIGVFVWGGRSPYALTVDWGDNSTNTLKSITKPGYFTVAKKYDTKGRYTITIRVSDGKGEQAYMQATIAVSGPPRPVNFVEYIGRGLSMSWFESPVPTYLLAVAVVLGFWAGDYFERSVIGTARYVHGKVAHKKRHHA